MKMKKVLSLIIAVCMIMQMLPVFATSTLASEENQLVYLANDDFGLVTESDISGLNGWTLKKWADGGDITPVLTTEEIGDGNYALKYTVTTADDWKYSYIDKALEAPHTFTAGQDVVIETRMKQTQSGGRSFVKFNMINTGTYNGQEWLYNWGTLLINEDGNVDTVNGWGSNNYAVQENLTTGLTNTWYKVKFTIHGNTKTISVVLDDENGNVYTKSNMSIDYKDAANWVEDVLNSFNFRMRDANTIYVDYYRAYILNTVNVALNVNEIKPSENIILTIDKEIPADAVSLVNANGETVDAEVTIDGNTVTIDPENNLLENETYKVVLNEELLKLSGLSVSNYEFTVQAIKVSGEFISFADDDFGASTDTDGGLNGWTLKEWADGVDMAPVLTTEEIEDGNYALKYTVTTADDWKYSYIDKTLETPHTFTAGQDIVIETRMKQTQSGGRSFVKFNMINTGTYNGQEWLYNWGTLLINEDGVVDTVNGWSASNYAVQERMATGLQNVWYKVKITIHGNTKTISVSVDDENGNVYTKSNMSIDYKDAAGWVEDVLNSFNFRMRDANTLYVDYYRAYAVTPVNVTLNTTEILKDENIILTVDKDISTEVISLVDENDEVVTASVTLSDGTITIDPENELVSGKNYKVVVENEALKAAGFYADTTEFEVSVKYEDVTVSVDSKTVYSTDNIVLSTDKEIPVSVISLVDENGETVTANITYADGEIIVDPENDLTIGDLYTVTIDEEALNTLGFSASSKSFTVRAVNKVVYGSVVNQQFNTENNTEGWIAGESNDVDATVGQTTFDGKGVLKISANENMPTGAGLGMSSAYFDMPKDIYFKDGAKILIKTSFYHDLPDNTTDSRISFKYNRPNDLDLLDTYDSVGYLGTLFMEDTGSLLVKDGMWSANSEGLSTILSNAGDKWIEVEMLLDFANLKGNFTVKSEGSVYTLNDLGLETKNPSDALESLAVLFRGQPSTVYFDYLKVAEVEDVNIALDKNEISKRENITFAVSKNLPENSVKLVDASGSVIEANITYDENKVTIDPIDSLTEESVYKVVLDVDVLSDVGMVSAQNEFIVSVGKSAGGLISFADDDFGATTDADGGLNGWTLKKWADGASTTPVLTTEEIGDGNYALKYTVTTADDWKYSYIDKALETPHTFTAGQDIVIETRMKQTQSGGRSFVKFNMKNTGTYNGQEWLYNWGTLLINEGGTVDTVNGWGSNNYAVQERMTTGLQNVWYTVKITIHGNTKTISVVLDDENGNVYTKSNMSIDYKDAAGWVEDVLNSFNFRMRDANTLYVDYFKAYALTSVKATVENSTVNTDENIVVILDKAIPVEAVSLKNANDAVVEAEITIDEDTNKVTINPENDLTLGDVYTVTFDKEILLESGFVMTNASLTVRVVNKGVYGIVVNQQFNTENNTEGWIVGESNNVDATVEQTTFDDKGVLKITANENMPAGAGLGMSSAYFDMPKDIYFKDGAKILIKTSFYHDLPDNTTDSRISFKYNRPNDLESLDTYDSVGYLGTLFMEETGSLLVKDGKWSEIADGFSTILSNAGDKWVEVEMLLDFANLKGNFTVKSEGSVYTLNDLGLETKNPSDILENLTVLFRGQPSTVYFDYLTVAEVDANAATENEFKAELLDENGDIVTDITENVKIVPTFTVKPAYGFEGSYELISAVYVNGVLDDMHIIPLTTTGEVYEDTTGWTFADTEGVTVKAFIWNSLTGMMPVSSVAEASSKH